MVLVFLAEGFEEIEALTPVDLLRRAGVEVLTVSITSELFVKGSHGITVAVDRTLNEVDFNSADCIVLPGGIPGTPNLNACKALTDKVSAFAADDSKYVAAICAAPTILGGLGILKGKNAIVFPGNEEKLTGAHIVAGAKVVVDGHIITSRGMGTAFDFGLALVEIFAGREMAEELGKKTQFR